MVSRKEAVKSCCVNILDDVKRILAQPFECRKTSLPDGALHNVQKELENMINAIDKDIYSFTPSYGKYLIDCWLGDELVDKLLDVSCQYEKLINLPKVDYPTNIIGLKIKIWIVNFNYSLKCY